jgi:hypothetical protein
MLAPPIRKVKVAKKKNKGKRWSPKQPQTFGLHGKKLPPLF